MICGVIMAGGKGTRFWPLSTEEKPKQFLNLIGEKTMIQMTVSRLEKKIPIEKIFIVTSIQYFSLVKQQVPHLPLENIIVEPCGRNTAPCIAWAAMYINNIYSDSTMIVLPSDHLIHREDEFINTIIRASEFVNVNNEAIVTLGIKPSRPEIGYGYIKIEKSPVKNSMSNIYKVSEFVEKPDFQLANQYYKDEDYFWNAGMFIWKTNHVIKLVEKYMYETYKSLKNVIEEKEKIEDVYPNLEDISIDYAIMEKEPRIYVIPSDFGWDDVGSWHALERYREKDLNNNIINGDITIHESRDNIVFSVDKQIVLVGIDEIFCIETDSLIFIGKKENMNIIKEIKDKYSL